MPSTATPTPITVAPAVIRSRPAILPTARSAATPGARSLAIGAVSLPGQIVVVLDGSPWGHRRIVLERDDHDPDLLRSAQLTMITLLADESEGDLFVYLRNYGLIPAAQAAFAHRQQIHILSSCPVSLHPSFLAVDHAITNELDRVRAATPLPSPDKTKPPRAVATDASVRLQRRGAGIACVDIDGRRAFEYLPDVSDVVVAELAAIELALRTFRGALDIRSDSMAAVQLLALGAERRPTRRKISDRLRRIDHLRADRNITVEWVRGHNGDPLNECADRLARHARRSTCSLPDSANNAIVATIMADLVRSL